MPRFCCITGKRCSFGNNVSHANNHTRRKFKANIHKRTLKLGPIGSFCFNTSTKGLRTICKKGFFEAFKKLSYGKKK
ncbi:MAG: 50S ribosomal protein L28 [Cytophagales bacterium]|nr:50S ribosomal protein L28 [Cytophagales bacterium]